MEKINWGVIGTAGIAKGQAIPGMTEAENCNLYAIAGRNIEKARAYQKEFGFEKAYGSYEELLEDPAVEAGTDRSGTGASCPEKKARIQPVCPDRPDPFIGMGASFRRKAADPQKADETADGTGPDRKTEECCKGFPVRKKPVCPGNSPSH